MFSRWAYDLAGALSGVPPRYFPEKDAALSALARRTTPSKVFPWINSVRDVRRVEDHPINAKVVVEQLLLAYLRAFVR
jgi:DNA polymerase-3 subunit delta'